MSFFKRFFKTKKPVVQEMSFTTDTATEGFNSRLDILNKLKNKPVISNEDLNVLSHLYFDITIKNTYYKLRNADSYGLYLEIKRSDLITDHETNELKDIILTLEDSAFNTSLKMVVSIKEFHELFVSFVPDFNFLYKKLNKD